MAVLASIILQNYSVVIVTAKSSVMLKDFHVNGEDSEKETEMTTGHNSYIVSAATAPGPGGPTNAFSSLVTPANLSLLFALGFLKWL